MTTRSRGPAAGFGWLMRGLDVAFRHPKPLLGGAALLLLACLAPSLVTLPLRLQAVHPGAPPSTAALGWSMALPMLIGLLIVPLYAGYLQVIDGVERGLPVRVRDVFKPYRRGQALRLIGYALLLMVIYVALFALILLAVGSDLVAWYMQAVAAQAIHQPPPELPKAFMIAFGLFMVLWLFMTGFCAISLGQISLGNRSVFRAAADGMAGALKNVLPLLVFALSAGLAWIVAMIGIVIVALLVGLIAKLVGIWLVFVVALPIYIAITLMAYAAMFGVMYHLWRDVCGDGMEPGMVSTPA